MIIGDVSRCNAEEVLYESPHLSSPEHSIGSSKDRGKVLYSRFTKVRLIRISSAFSASPYTTCASGSNLRAYIFNMKGTFFPQSKLEPVKAIPYPVSGRFDKS
jgi:hypothetical protein